MELEKTSEPPNDQQIEQRITALRRCVEGSVRNVEASYRRAEALENQARHLNRTIKRINAETEEHRSTLYTALSQLAAESARAHYLELNEDEDKDHPQS